MGRLAVTALALGFALATSAAGASPRSKRHETSTVDKASPKKSEKRRQKKSAKKTAKKSKRSKKSKKSARKSARKKRDDTPSRAETIKRIERPADYADSPAYRYSNLSREACEAELGKRKIPFEREPEPWLGVRAPVRLTGPLHGVTFRTRLSAEQRATTKWEIADCRLVLALDDFARILVTHDITDVIHYSMYRPPEKSHPADQDGIRHGGALALDAGKFVARDGTVLDVDKHWNGRRGSKTCGEDAGPRPATPEAKKLRAILCDAVAARIFNSYLTPNYDTAHKNHFHLEVTAGWRSFLIF